MPIGTPSGKIRISKTIIEIIKSILHNSSIRHIWRPEQITDTRQLSNREIREPISLTNLRHSKHLLSKIHTLYHMYVHFAIHKAIIICNYTRKYIIGNNNNLKKNFGPYGPEFYFSSSRGLKES